jgi:uncharacterized protein (TIGR00251 family)
MPLQYAGVADDLFDVISVAEAGGAGGEESGVEASAGPVSVRLRVHVRPGAGRSAVVGKHGAALAVRVAAPPVDGRANAACVDLLKDVLGVGDVELVRGERSADKQFVLRSVDLAQFRSRLHEVLDGSGAHDGTRRGKGRGRR